MNRKHVSGLGAVGLTIALAAPAVGQQAAPGNLNVLIVCGDENGTYAKCTSLDDRSLELHLRLDLGQRVTMMPDDTAEAEMRAAADAADLVIIPESVNSGSVGTKLTATSTPLINMEAFLQDEFQFVDPAGQSVDPGSPGAALFDGSPSPNLRVSLFTENNNDLGTYHRMTDDGHRLFDAALNWALTHDTGR